MNETFRASQQLKERTPGRRLRNFRNFELLAFRLEAHLSDAIGNCNDQLQDSPLSVSLLVFFLSISITADIMPVCMAQVQFFIFVTGRLAE